MRRTGLDVVQVIGAGTGWADVEGTVGSAGAANLVQFSAGSSERSQQS